MLHYALVFLVVALIAGLLGVSGVAAMATQIAYVLFVIAVVLFLVHVLTETNRQPRARAALIQPRAWCRDTPPGDTAAFFGDSPPKATTRPVCSAITDLAVALFSSTFTSAIT